MPVQNFGGRTPKKFQGPKTCKIWPDFRRLRSSAANISETDEYIQNRIFIPSTSSPPEQQITVSIDDDTLHHLTAIHLLPVHQISADVNEDLQRSLLHPDSLFTAGTADLQKRQRSSTVFATTIYRTNKKRGLRRLKNVTADGRYKYGLNVKSFTAVQKIRGNV